MTHSLTNPWPWPVRPLYWLYFLMDWLDDADRADHGKVQVDACLWVAIWFHYLGVPFSIGQLIVLLSASFGARVWLAFLKSRTVTTVEATVTTREITERRGSGTFEVTP